MVDVTISYETLFDILRREKQKEDIQELPPHFLLDVKTYLSQKEAILRKEDRTNPFLKKEQENTKQQVDNVKKILKELFERRENKIIRLAQDKVRTGTGTTAQLLEDEKILYTFLVDIFRKCRADLALKLLIDHELTDSTSYSPPLKPADPPLREEQKITPPAMQERSTVSTTVHSPSPPVTISPPTTMPTHSIPPTTTPAPQQSTSMPTPPTSPGDTPTKRVKFLSPLPRFLGKNMEVYGPFDQAAIADLPLPFADLLIRKGRAEEVK